MIAIIGGVVVLFLIVLAVMMMKGGGSGSNETAPAPTTQQEYDPQSQEPPIAAAGSGDEASIEEKKEEVVEVQVPADAPAVGKPTDIDGCVGWFTGESFDEDAQVWKDKSGKGNDCTEILGFIVKIDDDGKTYIKGTTEDGLKFPKECMTNNKRHTFFSVARYADISTAVGKHRIFDGVDANYLVGFHAHDACHGIYGTGHRDGNGWIGHWECAVHNLKDGVMNWVLHTDQKSLIRVNGARKTSLTTLGEVRTSQMTINWGMGRGWGQASNWEVGECIFFDRELTHDEIDKVELMLHKKWGIPRRIRQQQWMHHNIWDRYWNDATGGFTNEKVFKGLNRFGTHCGDHGVHYSSRFVQHHYWDPTSNTWKPNGNWGFDGGCISEAVTAPGAKKSTQWVSTSDSTSWQERLSKALAIDCGKNGLQNWNFETTPDGSQIRVNYQCSGDKLSDTCAKSFHVANGNGTDNGMSMPDTLQVVQAPCYGYTATNKLKFTQDAQGRWGYETNCCALEDV